MKVLAERLKKLRTENKLTLKQVQEGTGILYSLVGHYEKNRKDPSLDYFVRLVNYFKVSSDFLLGINEGGQKVKCNFCETLRSIRIEKKFGLKEFALLVGIKSKELELIENGSLPTIDTVEKIALNLEIDIEEFVDYDLNEDLEKSKIKLFAMDESNKDYILKVMRAKEKGISPDNIVIGEKL
ncbi:MAG: helix-turn-helix transcriptional regulator [Bacteroidota bacterium]|nr:helix-turn-helix transcriptional regulator [Bacteroidota bacterium]